MKAKNYLSTVLALGLLGQTGFAASQTVAVDHKSSRIEWRGSKVVGGSSHHGTINVKDGSVQLDGKKLVGGNVVVNMDSIVNEDLTDPKYNAKLVTHLKSDDFFDVQKFPTSTLTVKSGEQQKDGTYKVKADLTIKGVTKPIEFIAKTAADGKSIESDVTIDRTEWNVRYGSGKFFKNLGDKVIADKIELKIKLGFSSSILAAK